jgi:hypothetical protein
VDFLEDHLRSKIADEIRYLELPPDWRPYEVIRYIVRKIEEKVEQDVKKD